MSLLDYRAIRDQISIRRVLDLINYETVARKGGPMARPMSALLRGITGDV